MLLLAFIKPDAGSRLFYNNRKLLQWILYSLKYFFSYYLFSKVAAANNCKQIPSEWVTLCWLCFAGWNLVFGKSAVPCVHKEEQRLFTHGFTSFDPDWNYSYFFHSYQNKFSVMIAHRILSDCSSNLYGPYSWITDEIISLTFRFKQGC